MKTKRPPLNNLETLALTITQGIGSVTSIVVHTVLFICAFTLVFFGFNFDRVLLVVTTIVSLEAIYLSIFIQLSVNYQSRSLAVVEKDIDEIAEDVEEIQEDIDEIQEDVEEIAEDVEEMQDEDIIEITK